MNKFDDRQRPNSFQLIYPFWISGKNWKSWILVGICLGNTFGGVYVAVWSNRLAGQVVDAMVRREWSGLWPVLLTTLGVSVGSVILTIIGYSAYQLLNLEWRSWMTRYYVNAWVKHSAYYEMERDDLVSNADERISMDIQMFIADTMNLAFDFIQAVGTLISFSVILWSVSGTLTFVCFGRDISIPGYMVYVAVLYQGISFAITHLSGRRLVSLLHDKQTVEADFRYQGMQVRENAEQIAFYRGSERERQHLIMRFGEVIKNWKSIIYTTSRMMLFRGTYVQTGSIVPTVAALPRYLAGAISLGDVTRITGAFNQVSGALSFFSQAYQTVTEWLALSHRLRDLHWAIFRAEHLPRSIEVTRYGGRQIELSTISLALSNGELMARVPPIRIIQGERWLIRGRSGAGKSTYLRAIAGIWPYGEGSVRLPQGAALMFLPQRSYIPSGSLKAALCYPSDASQFSDEQCRDVLQQCLLGGYVDELGATNRWQQLLSGGEQQRLAIARVILQRPDFVFLDEATSAIDGETETALYMALIDRLPNSSIISVAHREALEAFHDHVLELRGADERYPMSPLSPAMALNINSDP